MASAEMDKSSLESLIKWLEIWSAVFGVIVVIGVAGESFFGIRLLWNNWILQGIQATENAQLLASAEHERLKRAELEARVSGRQITSEGLDETSKLLLPFRGQRIDMICEAEPEQIVLMNQLIEVMKSAHWDFNVSTAPEWNRAVGGVLVETVPHVDDKSARAANALVQALKDAPMAVPEQKLDVSGPLEAKDGVSPIFGGTFSGHKYQARPDDAPIKLTVGKLPPPMDIQP